MKKHLITILLFVLSIALYSIGAARPAIILLALGAFFELLFWYRIFGSSGKKN